MPSVSKPLVTGLTLGFLLGGCVFYAMSNINQNLIGMVRQLPEDNPKTILSRTMTKDSRVYMTRKSQLAQTERTLIAISRPTSVPVRVPAEVPVKVPAEVPTNVPLDVPGLVLPPGLERNRSVPINTEVTEDMSSMVAEEAFYRYIVHKDIICSQQVRLGHAKDGGWNMCLVRPFAPVSPCLVYSFGINNDWSFDDAISRRFSCDVRAFDPSMKVGDHRHSTRVLFYKTGIAGTDRYNNKWWKLRTLQTLVNELRDSKRIIDYLKIDVEYSEWESLTSMLSTGVLKRVRQFGIEIHTSEVIRKRSTNAALFTQYYNTLVSLEKQGFRRWYVHYNHFGKYISPRTHKQRTCCYELVYINMNFLMPGANLT